MGNSTINPGGFLLLVPSKPAAAGESEPPQARADVARQAEAMAALRDKPGTAPEVAALLDKSVDRFGDGVVSGGDATSVATKLVPGLAQLADRDSFEQAVGGLEQLLGAATGDGRDAMLGLLRRQRAVFDATERIEAPVCSKGEPTEAVRELFDHLRKALRDDGKMSDGECFETTELMKPAFRSVGTPEEAEELRATVADFASHTAGGRAKWLNNLASRLAAGAAAIHATEQVLNRPLGPEGTPTEEVRALVDSLQAALRNGSLDTNAEHQKAYGLAQRAFRSLSSEEEVEQLGATLTRFAQAAHGLGASWLVSLVQAETQEAVHTFRRS